MTVLLVAAGVASLLGLGHAGLAVCLRERAPAGLTRWALAWILGAGGGSFFLFLLLQAGLGLKPAAGAVVVTGFAALLLTLPGRTSGSGGAIPEATSPLVWFFLLATSAAILVGAFEAIAVPLPAWDAWVNWASKARLLFAEGKLTPALTSDPARLATNLDYPLLLPCLEAFFWTLRGVVDERLATLIPLSFHAAGLVLLYAAVRRFASAEVAAGAAALVAWTPLCQSLSPVGLSDPIVAGLVVATVFGATTAWRSEREAAFAGFLAGLLPWAKNEGALWLVLVACLLAARGTRPEAGVAGGRGRLLAAFALPALVPGGAWQLFLLLHGTVRYVYLSPTPANFLAGLERIPVLARTVGAHLVAPGWGFAWPAALVVLAVRGRDALSAREGELSVAALLFLPAASATFLLSRFDPWFPHVVNSIDRLGLQAFPLVAWWLAAQGVDAGVLPGARTERREIRP